MTLAPHDHNPRKGFLLALASTVLISTNFVTAKYALREFNVETFSTVWTAAAAFYSLLIVLVMGAGRELRLPGRASCVRLSGVGACSAANMLLSWAGLSLLDPSFNAFIRRGQPLFVVFLGVVFLRERLRRIEFAPMAVMLVGGIYSIVGRWEIAGLGIVLTILGDLFNSFERVMVKVEVRRVRPAVVAFYRLAIGSTLIAVWTFSTGRANFNVPLRYWAVLLVGALLGPCLSHVLVFQAYRHWTLSRCTMLLMIQPLLVLPMAWLFLGQLPSGRELIGGGILFAGAIWLSWIHFTGPGAPEAPPEED